MRNLSKTFLIIFSIISSELAFSQVSISPVIIGGSIDMTNGKSISLNLSNTSGTSQSIGLSLGSGFNILLNRCPATLAHNKVCTIMVGVSPQILSSGLNTTSLMNGSSSLVNLAYTKSTIAQVSSISISPLSLIYGALTRVGNSAPQYITIQNTGNVTVSPIIELSPKMALLINRCSSLQAGKSCQIAVGVSPTSDMSNGLISNQSVLIKKDSVDLGQLISISASLNIILACSGIQHQENGLCVLNARSCPLTNGTGNQTWSGSWSLCNVASCNSGFMPSVGACVAATQGCPILNGTGSQLWNGSSWGQCSIVSCNSGYENNAYGCTNRTVTTIAGNGTVGSENGQGTLATFSNLRDVTKDSLGNLYIADIFNGAVRKISPTGLVTDVNGSFTQPHGIIASSNDIIYVAESGGHLISKIVGGVRSVFAGNGTQGDVLGTGASARFKFPTSLTIDSLGNVYVFDSGNLKIKKITPSGVVTTFAGDGFANNTNGIGTSASLTPRITALTIDSSNNMYLVSGFFIKKITPLAEVSDFLSLSVSLNGLTIDKNNIFYGVNSSSHRVYKIDSLGNPTSLLGTFTTSVLDGVGLSATTFEPNFIMVDNQGTLYFTEYRGRRVRKIE